MDNFDFRNPDYTAVFAERIRRLSWLREQPDRFGPMFAYYRDHPADFINDWGMTYDPRNTERGLPASIPFILFPKQREWVEWLLDRWHSQEPGLTEKSRDQGMSWLSVAVACSLCNFRDGMTIGFGSRKEEYVDKIGHPKSLFWKARTFMEMLPAEFRRGWTKDCAPHMRISFPETGSVITGEAGDNIGRGDRASIYFVDESAFLERPALVEASLSATTNCRIDISSANGMGNPFAQKRFGGKVKVFTFHWRDDPRKDDSWYQRQCEQLDPVTVAQEIDINYSASATGILIPAAWINAAIDADKKLGFEVTGAKSSALDVADEGIDLNAWAGRYGIRLEALEEWAGKGSDIFETVTRAFGLCDDYGSETLRFDSDGLGAGVRGDARVINEQRKAERRRLIRATAFRGSGEVVDPDKPIPTASHTQIPGPNDPLPRTNKDYFLNAKAQGWWNLRVRFQRTARAVELGTMGKYKPDDLIVISGQLPMLGKLSQELVQPTYSLTTAGKIVVDKAPDGTKSPNLADSVMILYARDKLNGYSLESLKKAYG